MTDPSVGRRPPFAASDRKTAAPVGQGRRLVATDLDGTLLRSDESVSPFTRRVLADLDALGVAVLFVTGRPLRWMTDLWPLVGGHGMAIVSNGAIWFDAATRSVREARGIDRDAGLLVAEAISSVVPGAVFALEFPDGPRHEHGFIRTLDPSGDFPCGSLEELWTEPAVKLLVRAQRVDLDALRKVVADAVGSRATVTWSMPGLIEVSAPGVTKATALERVCAEIGVSSENVVAFGDMPNDLPMLTWAGTGYAMANADPALFEVAHHVAPSNDEDGVARVLAELFGLRPSPGSG